MLAAALVATLAAVAACAAEERALPTTLRGTAAERWREVADSGVKVRRD
jgi:hypothetical protein